MRSRRNLKRKRDGGLTGQTLIWMTRHMNLGGTVEIEYPQEEQRGGGKAVKMSNWRRREGRMGLARWRNDRE